MNKAVILFQALVSLFGLALVILFAVNPQVSNEAFLWRKPLAGLAFASICTLGMLASLFPNACSKPFTADKKQHEKDPQALHAATPNTRGHHPQCGHYSGHVITVMGKMLCATCSGLFVGAVLALIGVAIFFLFDWHVEQNAIVTVVLGVVGVGLGLFQSLFPVFQNGIARVLTGIFFVFGAFLILLGVESLTRSVSLDLFTAVLSLLWLATKISFSQWDHARICAKCESCDLQKT